MVVGVLEDFLVPIKPNITTNNDKQGVEQISEGSTIQQSKTIPEGFIA